MSEIRTVLRESFRVVDHNGVLKFFLVFFQEGEQDVHVGWFRHAEYALVVHANDDHVVT